MINGFIAVYRCNMDVGLYVLGVPSVNELTLASVLDCIFGSFEELLKYIECKAQAFIYSNDILDPKLTGELCLSILSRFVWLWMNASTRESFWKQSHWRLLLECNASQMHLYPQTTLECRRSVQVLQAMR